VFQAGTVGKTVRPSLNMADIIQACRNFDERDGTTTMTVLTASLEELDKFQARSPRRFATGR
jgi:hypothetical protein